MPFILSNLYGKCSSIYWLYSDRGFIKNDYRQLNLNGFPSSYIYSSYFNWIDITLAQMRLYVNQKGSRPDVSIGAAAFYL